MRVKSHLIEQGSDGPDRPVQWHAQPSLAVLSALETSAEGLSEGEASRRLAHFGPNRVRPKPPKRWWLILWDQCRSVVVWLLAAAVLVSWWTGERLEAAAIGVVIVLNAGLGFVTELRARQSIRALAKLRPERAHVVRGGDTRDIAAEGLVPGDVVALEEGMRVPADLRLLKATGLRTDEAILTGESAPVVKTADALVPARMGLHGRINLAFQGTAVVGGSALGVVTETGARTAVGNIGTLLDRTPEEETPLERKLDRLGHRLIGLTLSVAALVAVVGSLRGLPLDQTIKTGIALAVAAIPEGLPAIATIALAIGVRRMARRNALIRRLPSVETLGSVTVVCTDKTGTLTAGRMSVAESWTPYEGSPDRLLITAVLANRTPFPLPEVDGSTVLDPTELALVEFVDKMGVDIVGERDASPGLDEIPFTAETRMMASLRGTGEAATWFAKGAPEAILERCSWVSENGALRALTERDRQGVLAHNETFASDGLRVLAFAMSDEDQSAACEDLEFLGLIGLIDPPAEGVADTVATLRDAGIRVQMLTGDQRLTGAAVGRMVGIGDETLTAHDVSNLPAGAALPADIAEAPVLARVSPEQKLKVVKTLQSAGEVVAMLGDGVNDAAAIKRADVGVAMGQRGSEVARQASDVVLQDDRFSSVAAAVAEGRVVFSNIRKFAFYLFSCNLAEVLVLLIAGVLGWPLPLLPLQILWLNLVTDTFPALALAFEPAEEGLMRRPPRPPERPILTRSDVEVIGVYGALIAAVTLTAFWVGLQKDPLGGSYPLTVAFLTLALAQIFHLGNARARGPVLAPARITANGYAIAGSVLSVVLLGVAVAYPPLRSVLGITVLPAIDWLWITALASIPAIGGQVAKLWVVVRTPEHTSGFVYSGPGSKSAARHNGPLSK